MQLLEIQGTDLGPRKNETAFGGVRAQLELQQWRPLKCF